MDPGVASSPGLPAPQRGSPPQSGALLACRPLAAPCPGGALGTGRVHCSLLKTKKGQLLKVWPPPGARESHIQAKSRRERQERMWPGGLGGRVDGRTVLDGAAWRAAEVRTVRAVPAGSARLGCQGGPRSSGTTGGAERENKPLFPRNADGLNVRRDTAAVPRLCQFPEPPVGADHRPGRGPGHGLGSQTHPRRHDFTMSPASAPRCWSVGPGELAPCMLRAALSVFPSKGHHM